jgi:sodium/hydrogen exchanger 8
MSRRIVHNLLLCVTLLAVFIAPSKGAAAGPATGGDKPYDRDGDQEQGCISLDFNKRMPSPSGHNAIIDRYEHELHGGQSCCPKNSTWNPTENLVASMSASLRGLYQRCGMCAESWEYIFFAAICSPVQSSFLSLNQNGTAWQLNITEELALSMWRACRDDDNLVEKTGRYGIQLKFIYFDQEKIAGVEWDDEQKMASHYVEDTDMRLTPALYLRESTTRLELKVLNKGAGGYDTAMDEQNLMTKFRVPHYCASSGDPLTAAASSIMIDISLLFFGTWISNFLHLRHISWLPESGVFIVFGAIYGSILLATEGKTASLKLEFDALMLNLVLLPPIIFYSGFSMHHSNFGANLSEILVLAVVGTLVSTFGLGFSIYGLNGFGSGFSDYPTDLNIYECLAFAALISAVDPVATLATFDALQVDPNVEVLIFGESLLNDAVAIVLYKSFAKFAQYGGVTDKFGYSDAGVSFLTLTFGSILIGILCTVLQALVFKYTFFKHTPVLEILTFMFLAYSSFIIAEYFHWSGIIASLLHGVGCALFVKPNMSEEGHFRAELISHSLAALADMLIFIMVGYTGVSAVESVVDVSWALTFWTLGLCLILRAVSTFPLVAVLNLCRKKHRQVGMNEAFLMWWSGLRGAIAIGLVADVPSAYRGTMMSSTCLIVFFTVFVLGGGTATVLKKMGILMGINRPKAHGELGGKIKQFHNILIRLLTNQDENDDGIDDRYQSHQYNREMSRRGSIVASTMQKRGTINVLNSADLMSLTAKANLEKTNAESEESPEQTNDTNKSTLNWE